MNNRWIRQTAMGALLLAAAACGQKGASSGTTIAVIPKGTSHMYWQSIHAGANQAAKELGVEVIWRGPIREDDRDSQVSEVEGFVSRGVSGIVLAPLDEAALVAPVADAKSFMEKNGITNTPDIVVALNSLDMSPQLLAVNM